MTTNLLSQSENPSLPMKSRTSAFSSASHGLAGHPPLKTTKRRFPRESATASKVTKSAKTISLGSTFPGGKDPFHAIIVRYGEPTHWIQMRDFEARYRMEGSTGEESNSPPDPQFYAGLGSSPVVLSSGVDIHRKGMVGEEFWERLGRALKENLEGEGKRGLWDVKGEWRRGLGSLLWEEREREEEREDGELVRSIYEVGWLSYHMDEVCA